MSDQNNPYLSQPQAEWPSQGMQPPEGTEPSMPPIPSALVPPVPAPPVAQQPVFASTEQTQAYAYPPAPQVAPQAAPQPIPQPAPQMPPAPQATYQPAPQPPYAQPPEVAWGTLTGQPPQAQPAPDQRFFMDKVAGGRFGQSTFWIFVIKIVAWVVLAWSIIGGFVNMFTFAELADDFFGDPDYVTGFTAMITTWLGGVLITCFLMVVAGIADDVHKLRLAAQSKG